MSPTLQRSLRHIRFELSNLSDHTLFYLSKVTNLRTIELDNMHLDTESITPLIQANKGHLHTLVLWECRYVDDTLLDAIAECKDLRVVDMGKTKISPEAIEKYREAKRPNWHAIKYTKGTSNSVQIKESAAASANSSDA